MNFFKNLFGRNTTATVEPTNESLIDRELFIDELMDEPGATSDAPSKPKGGGLLDELLGRDHFGNGYRDGVHFSDPGFIEHYRNQCIAETTHLLRQALSELRGELCEVRSHAEQIGTITDPYLLHTVNTRINKLVLHEERLLDELVASEESRGRLGLALQRYRDGFIRGLKDRDASNDPTSRFGL